MIHSSEGNVDVEWTRMMALGLVLKSWMELELEPEPTWRWKLNGQVVGFVEWPEWRA